MKQYNAKYFHRFFSNIPEDQWTIETQQNELGQRCAFGHFLPISKKQCGSNMWSLGMGGHRTDRGCALNTLFLKGIEGAPAIINNGYDKRFQQETPKQRILAALEEIIIKEGGEIPVYNTHETELQVVNDELVLIN